MCLEPHHGVLLRIFHVPNPPKRRLHALGDEFSKASFKFLSLRPHFRRVQRARERPTNRAYSESLRRTAWPNRDGTLFFSPCSCLSFLATLLHRRETMGQNSHYLIDEIMGQNYYSSVPFSILLLFYPIMITYQYSPIVSRQWPRLVIISDQGL
jgi:hypothetical protein